MTRSLVSLALTATLAIGAAASPIAVANAQTNAAQPLTSYFQVELAAPTEEAETIAGGVLFRCEGTSCTGPRSRDRDLRVCSELRRDVGTIASFTANGEPLSDRLLARCNG